jgi:hypothetical protein
LTTPPTNAATDPLLASDSRELRDTEILVIQLVAERLGLTLAKQRRVAPSGAVVEFDGLSEDPPVVVEAWAHQGPPRPAQKYKVMTDTLKLVWANQTFFASKARKILALTDTAAAAHFQGK